MNSIATWIGAMAMVAVVGGYPQKTTAEGFDGVAFLTWTDQAQDSYFQTSITMAAIMATKTRPTAGDCLDTWYLAPEADRATRNAELRSTISRNNSYHPSTVIFLVLEQACGPFVEAAN